MARKETWDLVKEYFKPREFDDPAYPNSGEQIDDELLLKLYRLREETGWAIITHWQVGGAIDVDGRYGHAPNSYHLLKNGAKAVDFHFKTNAPVNLQIYYVLKQGFGGVGIYYDWHWNGKPLPVGFHVDVRSERNFVVWKRIHRQYIYIISTKER